MTRRTPLEFDLSVSSAKKKSSRKRGMSGEIGAGARECEWEGCEGKGAYRAPKSRDHLDEFRWFCLDHVREYNRRWNFYENMAEDEIQENMRSDQLWGRPTWKLGKAPGYAGPAGPHSDGEAWRRFGFEGPLEVLGDKGTLNPGSRQAEREMRARRLPESVRKALDVLDLDVLTTRKEIRARYKELVKRFHPDQNGGDRSEEARLAEVLRAWESLKSNPMFKD